MTKSAPMCYKGIDVSYCWKMPKKPSALYRTVIFFSCTILSSIANTNTLESYDYLKAAIIVIGKYVSTNSSEIEMSSTSNSC